MLTVIDHDPFTACSTCDIVLYVYGIYNPMLTDTDSGQFKIGVLDGWHYTEYN